MLCGLCTRVIGERDFAELKPCDHIVCPQCLINALYKKAKFGPLVCPCNCCHQDVNCHVYFQHNCSNHEEQDTLRHSAPTISLDVDPIRHFNYALDPSERSRKTTLAVAYATRDGKPRFFGLCLDGNVGPQTPDEKEKLKIIFALLYPLLVSEYKNSEEGQRNQTTRVQNLSPEGLEDYAIHKDSRFIRNLVHSLVTGRYDRGLDVQNFVATGDKNTRKQLLGSFVMTEVMTSLVDSFKSQRLQTTVGHELALIEGTSKLQKTLSMFDLSIARNTVRHHTYSFAVDHVAIGRDASCRDFLLVPADNVEFYGPGKVDNWCHILIRIVPEEQLKKDGFYNKDVALRHCRDDDKEFGDLVDTTDHDNLFTKIYGIRDQDFLLFSNRILQHLETVRTLDLPAAIECEDMAASGVYDCGATLPRNLGVVLPETEPIAPGSEDYTMYERNNLFPQMPFHAPFSRRSSLREITKSAILTNKGLRARASPDETDEHEDGPPVQDLMTALAGDGFPANDFLIEKADSINDGDGIYTNVFWFFGMFHTLMNAVRACNGKLFHWLFGWFLSFYKSHRGTEFVLNCGDITGAIDISFQYLCANYRNVADNLKRIEDREVTAQEIHEHMRKRAREHGLCMMMFLHLRFIEMFLMLRDAERSGSRGDVGLALCAIR